MYEELGFSKLTRIKDDYTTNFFERLIKIKSMCKWWVRIGSIPTRIYSNKRSLSNFQRCTEETTSVYVPSWRQVGARFLSAGKWSRAWSPECTAAWRGSWWCVGRESSRKPSRTGYNPKTIRHWADQSATRQTDTCEKNKQTKKQPPPPPPKKKKKTSNWNFAKKRVSGNQKIRRLVGLCLVSNIETIV